MLTRSIVSALLLVAILGSSIVSPSPAIAQSVRCETGFERIGQMVRQERRRGVTQEWLKEINTLIPFLIECISTDPLDGDIAHGADRWGPLAAAYFRIEDVPRVLCLMEHESGGDPMAQNPSSGASGLMQIMPFWAGRHGVGAADLFDPMVNLEIASWIRDQQGWVAWSPYQRGLCR